MPHVVSIVYTPANVERKPSDRYARVAVERATLVEGSGIDGDAKGRGGSRQLNVLHAEAVASVRGEGFRAGPGELGEQVVIAGLGRGSPAVGVRLRLGESAVIEVTEPRTGCGRFAAIQGRSKDSADGRLGFMARVLRGGEVAVGDAVRVEPADSSASPPSWPSDAPAASVG
jgi:MOSC domain-containing protein YiiM